MNQRDPTTDRYLGNRNGNKSTGFKKNQNQKRQVNQMQGTRSRAFMDRDTWNVLEESDKKAWDGLSEPGKTKITAYHFKKGKEYASQSSEVNQKEAKEHELIFDDSEDELEAKQHDILVDDSEEEPEEGVEVNKHETIQVSNAESTRKMYEDEGVDFDMILQAQQANTRLQTYKHELFDSDSSYEELVADLQVNVHNFKPKVEELVADLQVNVHNFKPKVEGLLEFANSNSEDEFAIQYPGTMEEALAHDARGEIDDPDEEIEELIEEKATTRIPEDRMPKGLLHFDNSDEDEETFQIHAYGFTSSKEESIPDQPNDGIEGEVSESIIGEQEGDTSGLIESDTDRHQLVDEFYAQDGLWKFSDSEDEAEDKGEVGTKEQEAKVMTRSECEKAGIKPPPVDEVPYPANRKPRSVSPKPTSPKITKTTSPKQQTKATSLKQSPKIKVLVATDAICSKQDPQHQPGSIVVVHNVASPKQTSTKSLVAPMFS